MNTKRMLVVSAALFLGGCGYNFVMQGHPLRPAGTSTASVSAPPEPEPWATPQGESGKRTMMDERDLQLLKKAGFETVQINNRKDSEEAP